MDSLWKARILLWVAGYALNPQAPPSFPQGTALQGGQPFGSTPPSLRVESHCVPSHRPWISRCEIHTQAAVQQQQCLDLKVGIERNAAGMICGELSVLKG